jgi:hypothetical protein
MHNSYEDDPKYLAKIEVGDREIKLRTSPEFEEFIQSLLSVTEPEEMLRASAWINQMCCRCVSDPSRLDLPPVDITVKGIRIPAFTTPAGQVFFRSLKDIEDHDHRTAAAIYLKAVAQRMFEIALHLDPCLVPQD